MRRSLLSLAALAALMPISSYEKRCKGEMFPLYNRMVCPDCLTATVDGYLECGTNIDHYQPFSTNGSRGGLTYSQLVITGDCEFAYMALRFCRMMGYSGYIVL